MKDRFFYPLAALVIAAMIAFALSFQVDNTPSDIDVYERSGAELEELFPSPGTTVVMLGSNEDSYARLSAHMSRDLAPSSAGVFGTLGTAYEENFGGATIRITVRARNTKDMPSSAMELGYFTSDVGDSGWQSFELTDSYADYSFEFSPQMSLEEGNDYIGIWPDPSGKGGAIDVQSVKVQRVRSVPTSQLQ